MTATPLSIIHRYEPATDPGTRPLLLLHGTGRDEADLIPLGRTVAPGAALLSPRGKVLENGAPRFFRRLAEGVFDEADVVRRAHELADFIDEALQAYGLEVPLALGYSNGANIAAALMLLRPEALAGAILLRPMMPLTNPPAPDLSGKAVLILSGLMDPIAAPRTVGPLDEALRTAGAQVEHAALPAGHQLSQADLTKAMQWLGGGRERERLS